MPTGVVMLDGSLRPVVINNPARELLGIRDGHLPTRLPTLEVTEVAAESQAEGTASRTVSVWYPARLDLSVQAADLKEGQGVLVVLQDVTEEVRTQQIRREFVAHASHELKSPVASLQVLSEAIVQSAKDDPEAAATFASKLSAEADRLGQLIADLLDLSRLEEESTLAKEPVDMTSVVRKEIADAERLAQETDLTLASDIAPGCRVMGDRRQLATMVRNLLDNAIRYTTEKGNVRIDLEQKRDAITLVVRDDGIGIPKEAQPRIFERFYRVDRARSRDRGGTGLGLAIVKHVVELHGGEIDLTSELGTGSRFTVRLPLAGEPAPGRPGSYPAGSPDEKKASDA